MSQAITAIKAEFEILGQAVRKANRDGVNDLAAAIAFWAFLSIFPLLIGIFSLAGHFLESAQLQTHISEVVSDMLPGTADLVRENLVAVMRYRGSMSWVGILGLLWTAGKAFGAITRSVNRELGAAPERSFLFSKLQQFFMVIALTVLMIASTGISVALEFILEPRVLSRLGFDAVHVPRFRGWVLSFVLVFLIFALIYKMAPHVTVAWHKVWPGALLATSVFECVKAAFLFYLERVAQLHAIYGSLSSIIALLLWLYLSALILVFGAEYNIVRSQEKFENAAP